MHHKRTPRPEDHKRMTIFFVAAAIIMGLSYFFITKPAMERIHAQQAIHAQQPDVSKTDPSKTLRTVDEVLAEPGRIKIENDNVLGSLSPKGLRFDDLQLKGYDASLGSSDLVRLLSPADTKTAYFVEIGVLPADQSIKVPDQNTIWKVTSGTTLNADNPVVLEWDNGQGVVFRRNVTIDRRYVITVVQDIRNNTENSLTFYPYALISQSHHLPAKGEKVSFEDRDASVQHIGPIAYLNEELEKQSYSEIRKDKTVQFANTKGWLGITSKYWMTTLLPESDQSFDARFAYQTGALGQDIYQVDMRQRPVVVAAHDHAETPLRFFAGAKKLTVLDDYKDQLKVDKLDLSVDFGRLYILTRPLYHILSYMGNYIKTHYGYRVSFGIALLLLTVLVRLVMFPLQNKSYASMNKMKDLSPKLHALKEQYKDDKPRFQQEVMELYKREKVNPASGCLPILIQIPIFFSLYKVIYITLDMRHAPFWGWIHDLSSPDPTNIWNLFGLLHFNTPEFMVIGIWPLLYGITMWTQQRFNPKPEDPTQQQIFAIMPWLFMFIFAKLPAGLVIYYTWSNCLGIIQQYFVRRMNPPKLKPEDVVKEKPAK